MRTNPRSLMGQVFGRLTVVGLERRSVRLHVICNCICGKSSAPTWNNVRAGRTRSCGCLEKSSRIKHGFNNTPTHNTWENMINRCGKGNAQNLKTRTYQSIEVCERWRSFKDFLADMGPRPKGRSLDRIDNTKGYFPGNCRWATQRQQMQNRSVNRLLTYRGQTKCQSEWSRELGIPLTTIFLRLRRGSVEQAFEAKKYSRISA